MVGIEIQVLKIKMIYIKIKQDLLLYFFVLDLIENYGQEVYFGL